jgi:hypothetical protein
MTFRFADDSAAKVPPRTTKLSVAIPAIRLTAAERRKTRESRDLQGLRNGVDEILKTGIRLARIECFQLRDLLVTGRAANKQRSLLGSEP